MIIIIIIEYLKIVNLLDNKTNQPTKFKTRNLVEINDDACGTYNTISQIKLKTTMLKPSLCDYSKAYIIVKVLKTITGEGADAAAEWTNERSKQITFKSCAPFTDCMS